MKNKGKILIVSGPSGCGKSTVLSKVFEEIPRHFFSISATTRSPRPGEKDGVDYYVALRYGPSHTSPPVAGEIIIILPVQHYEKNKVKIQGKASGMSVSLS